MFQQIRCKSIQSVIYTQCYFNTIIISIILNCWSILYITNIYTCLQDSLVNNTHVIECQEETLTVRNVVILNLILIIINFLAFIIMSIHVNVIVSLEEET